LVDAGGWWVVTGGGGGRRWCVGVGRVSKNSPLHQFSMYWSATRVEMNSSLQHKHRFTENKVLSEIMADGCILSKKSEKKEESVCCIFVVFVVLDRVML
jgi:hypothetical protein